MTLTERQWWRAAVAEIIANDVQKSVAWYALTLTETGEQFDDAIQAALQASEDLERICVCGSSH